MLATQTIAVRLNADELAALRNIASREDRDVRRQAARLIRAGLVQADVLRESETAAGVESASAAAAT